MAVVVHLDSTFPANEDEVKDYSKLAEHFELAVSVVSLVTSLVLGSSVDEVTSEVWDSSVVITEETEPDIEDCFRVVRQVFVLSWVSRLELVVEPQLMLLPFDFHSLATFRVPFDGAFEQGYDLEESDDSLGSFAASSSKTDVDLQLTNDASLMEHVDFVVPSEIVAGIGIAVEFHVMILIRVVGPRDSWKDVEADATAVAVDDFEVFESNEIVVSAGCQVVVNQLDPDWADAHSLSDPIPYDCSLDVELMKNVNSDAERHNHRMVVVLELVVVELDTFGVHFVDNVEIFSVGLAVDAVIEGWIRNPVEESYHSSYSVVKYRPLASV